MRYIVAASVALATILASPAFAAPTKHRAPVARDTMEPYGAASEAYVPHRSDVVTLGNRVVGEDPDLNIRSGILHDPTPSEY